MEILVVDGYNIIGAWEELERLRDIDMSQARDRLIELMAEYQAYSGERVIVVFDAHEVHGLESKFKQHKVEVIYTKEKETADECIERLIKTLKNVQNQVYVATSDYAEQRTIFSQGALRKSARELYIEIQNMDRDITERLEIHQKVTPKSKIILDDHMMAIFEKWRRGK